MSNNGHPVDGGLLDVGSLWPEEGKIFLTKFE
jgi:hypothetical protein